MFWGCFAASGTGCLEFVQGRSYRKRLIAVIVSKGYAMKY